MLHEFLKANRTELTSRCSVKAAKRAHAQGAPAANEHAIPQFLDQLIETFRAEQTPEALARHKAMGHGKPSLALVPSDINSTAAKHGSEMHRQGLTVDQVVHAYGDLCQALTELALEKDVPITVDEFHTFNRCLDDAIADAVTAFTKEPGRSIPMPEVRAPNAQATSPVHEMRILIETAIHSFAAIKGGSVSMKGATSSLHERTLGGLRDLMDRVLADAGGPAAPAVKKSHSP